MTKRDKPPAKRRGRPPAGPSSCTERVTTKLTPDTMRALEVAARAGGVSVSEWTRDAIVVRLLRTG